MSFRAIIMKNISLDDFFLEGWDGAVDDNETTKTILIPRTEPNVLFAASTWNSYKIYYDSAQRTRQNETLKVNNFLFMCENT